MREFADAAYSGNVDKLKRFIEDNRFNPNTQYLDTSESTTALISDAAYYAKLTTVV